MHSFKQSQLDARSCMICGRASLQHTKVAQCESCPNVGPCELIMQGSEEVLMCARCQDLAANPIMAEEVISDQVVNQRVPEISIAQKIGNTLAEIQQHSNDLLARAKELDGLMKWNGDMFNAETVPHVTIKQAIWSEENLTEDQKQFKYAQFMLERLNQYSDVMFKTDEVKFICFNGINVIERASRELAENYRKEIRAKLKEQDDKYAHLVEKKPVKADVPKKQKASPMDMLVKAFMDMRGCTETEARLIIMQGTKSQGGDK